MSTQSASDVSTAAPEIEWKKIGRDLYVRCSKCNTFRGVSYRQLQRLQSGQRNNICSACNRAANKQKQTGKKRAAISYLDTRVDVKCPKCGKIRKLKLVSVRQYKSKGLDVLCSKCCNRNGSLSLFDKQIHGPLPVIEIPKHLRLNHYRCGESGYFKGVDECPRYHDCLDWACAHNWDQFTCGLPNAPRLREPAPQRSDLLEAYEHSRNHGFLPDSDSMDWLNLH